MTNEPRFVVDTNVIVSAALFQQSLPRIVINWVISNSTLLASVDTIYEMVEVLSRSRFNKHLSQSKRLDFAAYIRQNARTVVITITITDCRDLKDNKFLELAVEGDATCIVSSDQDLLILHPFRDIPILMPHGFLEQYGK